MTQTLETTGLEATGLHAIETVAVAASAASVFDLIVDVARWPQFFTNLIHTLVEPSGDDATDVVRCWGVRGHDAVRVWSARRWIDTDALRVDFDNDPPPPGVRAQHGRWQVEPAGENACTVTLSHTFDCGEDVPEQVAAKIATEFAKHSAAQLAELKDAAERAEELDQLVIGWEDTLFASGTAADAWVVLYEADKWPERIPHVARIDMTEPAPGVQFFDMDTSTPDGRPHTTRSVRVCFPHELIVYKQTTLPPMLDAHTGHWRFAETPEGVVIGARHTVTLKKANLSWLGPDATIADARRYARKVLGTNSMKNLQIAKAYAEQQADA